MEGLGTPNRPSLNELGKARWAQTVFNTEVRLDSARCTTFLVNFSINLLSVVFCILHNISSYSNRSFGKAKLYLHT